MWRILNRCEDVWRDVYLQDSSIARTKLEPFHEFILQTTATLNATKKDMERYIYMIENRKQNPRLEDLNTIWALEKLIPFTETRKAVVRNRNWYIDDFSFDLPTAGGPSAGGSYATFARPRTAHAKCDIYSLLSRLEKL